MIVREDLVCSFKILRPGLAEDYEEEVDVQEQEGDNQIAPNQINEGEVQQQQTPIHKKRKASPPPQIL